MLNGNLKTEMVRLNLSLLRVRIIKKPQRGIVVWFQDFLRELHPALLTSCSLVRIFVMAANLGRVVQLRITDNSIRSLSCKTTHHIFV